jgi:hypothetical protein
MSPWHGTATTALACAGGLNILWLRSTKLWAAHVKITRHRPCADDRPSMEHESEDTGAKIQPSREAELAGASEITSTLDIDTLDVVNQ